MSDFLHAPFTPIKKIKTKQFGLISRHGVSEEILDAWKVFL